MGAVLTRISTMGRDFNTDCHNGVWDFNTDFHNEGGGLTRIATWGVGF